MVKNFKYIGRPTLLLAMATAVIGVVFSSIVAWKFHLKEQAFLVREFRNDVEEQVRSIERQVQLDLESLYTFKMLFESSEEVTAAEFAQAATDTLERLPDLESIYWVAAAGEQGHDLERVYSYSRGDGETPLLNHLTDSQLRATLKAGGNPDTLDARPVAQIPAGSDRSSLYVAGMPVFRHFSSAADDRRKDPLGFVLATFRVGAIVQNALNRTVATKINLTLRDGTADLPILYRHRPDAAPARNPRHEYRGTLLPFADRQWQVRATPTPQYLAERSSMQPLVIFFAGAGLVALATGLFTVLLRHSWIADRMVEARTRELNRLNEKLERLSQIDKLTGVANRRFFDEHLEREWKRSLRSGTPLALIMIDIDHFKLYNDFYGHVKGDKCLTTVARCLEKNLKRPGDLVARYGGEEFACVLPETGQEGMSVAEGLRAAVENLRLPNPAPDTGGILTISVGFSFITPSDRISGDALVAAADGALYRAKRAGRNRVAMHDGQPVGDNPGNS